MATTTQLAPETVGWGGLTTDNLGGGGVASPLPSYVSPKGVGQGGN